MRVNNLTDQAIQALGERHATLERIHLSYCDQISVMAIHFLLQKLPKLTHLSLTGITAFRRAELQQFCRPPPAVRDTRYMLGRLVAYGVSQDFNSTQRAAFCVYSGKGVHELREFLAELCASITSELATSNDTDYEDFEEDDRRPRRDVETEVIDEDEDDEDSEPLANEHSDAHATPRLTEQRPPIQDTTVRQFFPSTELAMTREPGRNPTSRAQPRAQPANRPPWLSPVIYRPMRGFGQQPIVEQSTSPTPSEAASNRSAGTNQSAGTAFFRTYAEAPTSGRNGVMTPDLVYAEIGHGRGAGPGPSTILVQNHARREPVIEPSFPSASSSPTRYATRMPPPSSIGMAASGVFSATARPFRLQDHDHGHILHDASNSYLRSPGQQDNASAFSVLQDASPPSPTTRELQESVHSALAGAGPVMDGDARGRSVKRTLRSTFAAAETFFMGRNPGGGDGPAGMPGGRDADTHGH